MKYCLLTLFCLVSWMLMSFVPMSQTSNQKSQPDSMSWLLNQYKTELTQFQVYNDSIYLPMDSAQWIPFFKRRAALFSEFYRTNTQRIRLIKQLLNETRAHDVQAFSDTMSFGNAQVEASNARLQLIFHLYSTAYFESQSLDVFLAEDLLEYIRPEVEQYMPHSPYAYFYYATLAFCKYNLASVDQESSLEESWRYFRKVLDMSDLNEEYMKYDSGLEYAYQYALYFSMDVMYAYEGVLTLDEIAHNVERTKQFLSSHVDYYQAHKDLYGWLNAMVTNYPMRILSQYVWKDNYDYHSALTDSAAAQYVCKMEHQASCDSTKVRLELMRMKVYLGQVSPDSAFQRVYPYLKMHYFDQYKGLGEVKLKLIFGYYSTLLFYNDRSNRNEEDKCRFVQEMVGQMVSALRACSNVQSLDVKALLASYYLTSPLLLNHLTPNQRKMFLSDIFVSCQVQTVTHSRMVGRLSRTLLEGTIKYHPDWLVGLPQVGSLWQLKHRAKVRCALLDFMEEAGQFHDLGKITMAEIVRNDFRPLTDHEFAILQKHPDRGLKFLHIAPSKDCYRDLLEGHHRWYDGKRGYPKTFDNVSSPYRILIDILTLADCLEAATDQLGRRYSNAKKFDMMMQEFRSGAGTRYNADLVHLIDTHPDVADRLRYMVEQGWYGNYYEIYHKYFSESYEDALQ